MKRLLFSSCLLSVLAGCEGVLKPEDDPPEVQTPSEETPKPVVRPGEVGERPDALDTTTQAEKEAATQTASGGARLGKTQATLGNPAQQGFWLETPLVDTETAGRVVREGGATVNVTLIPIDGPASAGSRISLAAMRALGLDLTDIATLEVLRG